MNESTSKRTIYHGAVPILGKSLEGLKEPHLNSGCRIEHFRSFSEKFGDLNLTLCVNNFALGIPPSHGGRDQLILQLFAYSEIYIAYSLLFRHMFSTAIPQLAMTGLTCFSISSVMSAFFSRSSWKVKMAMVFLMIPPAILIKAACRFSTRYSLR